MILAIDTNILLDILIPNTAHAQSSLNYLMNVDQNDEIVICEVVYSELGSQFLSFKDLNRFLDDTCTKIHFSKPVVPGKNIHHARKVWLFALSVVITKNSPVPHVARLFLFANIY